MKSGQRITRNRTRDPRLAYPSARPLYHRLPKWCSMKSGVPQGLVLSLMMFLVYVNDMTEGVNSYTSQFADDAKLLRKI